MHYKKLIVISAALTLLPLNAWGSGSVDLPPVEIELSPAAIENGQRTFMETCRLCHGLKYFTSKENPGGITPTIDSKAAQDSFGTVPPDLSLMAKARGKRLEGALYIYSFLTSYYLDEKGVLKNRAFAEQTQTEGVTAMPQPFSNDDPEIEKKSHDVAAFLYTVAEPTDGERKTLGKYVLIYMALLTGLLYFINRRTWKGVKK